MAKKLIIIHLPNGKEICYSTVDLGDTNYTVVDHIAEVRSNVPQVVITDSENEQHIYKGFPYYLNVWTKTELPLTTKRPR